MANPTTKPAGKTRGAKTVQKAGQPTGLNATADAPTGNGKSVAEMVRKSNLWRDNYNPLRALTIARLIGMFEAAERGAYAELQLLLRKVEKRYPVLKALKARRLSALQKLDWSVKTVEELPEGATQAQAEAQQKFLKSRYELITNLREAFGQIALSEFRGYAILQKHRYTEGANDGAVEKFYWLEPWCFARDGFYGDFFYNQDSRIGVGLGSCVTSLGEQNRIGGEFLPREEFIIRESESPLYEIALTAFVNWLMGRKDFSAFVEIFGLPNSVVIMPPNITPGKEADYQAAAEKVADGVSGALPNGSDVKFPSAGTRSEMPFEKYCDAQDKDVVLAGTGGLLTMLSMPTGIGSGASEQHDDAFDDIAQADALKISEVLQRDFDRVELAAQFPGQPILAFFDLAAKDETDVSAIVADVQKLSSAGYKVNREWLQTKTGYELDDEPEPETPPTDEAQPTPEEAAIRNRLVKLFNRAGADKAEQFYLAIAADLKPLQDRLAAIDQISDDTLRQQKLSALYADLDQLIKDITADPETARVLENINAGAVVDGLKNNPAIITNRVARLILNSNPNNDEQGRFASGPELATFHDESVSQSDNQHRVLNYRAVDAAEAAKIRAATGIDVSGHSHAVDNYALRHINAAHGNPDTEIPRGQLPVTREDVARLPEITSSPDKIEHAGETKLGRAGIRYTKHIGGKTVVVEEVRTKAKLLVPVSIQKFKNRVTIDARAPISTSKTLHPQKP